MKIKILKVSERSSHFGAPYSLEGMVGVLEKMKSYPSGETFFALLDCRYENPDPNYLENGDRTCLFADAYEVVEQ